MNQRPDPEFTSPACLPFMMEGGEHGVLLMHGFTGTIAHMRPLADQLHQRGYTVMGINLPGHAVSMEAMAKSTWQEWLGAAKDAFLQLQKRCRYVSVAGLSMGGCLALLLAEQMHPTAVVPISAPMAVQTRLLPLTGLVWPFLPRVMWEHRGDNAHLLDGRYDIGYPGFPTRCGMSLYRIMRSARRDLHAVQCPVLIVQSHQDETITHDSADIIARGVSSEKVGTLWLEGVPHVCTISSALPQIVEAMDMVLRSAETNEKDHSL